MTTFQVADDDVVNLVASDWGTSDGFRSVVARHGDNAVEFYNIKQAMMIANAAKAEGEQTGEQEETAA